MPEPRRAARLRLPTALIVGLLIVAPVAMARYTTPPTGARLRPLPGSPVVKKTAREVIEFEGQDHSPKVEVKWKYSVEATTRSGHALGGKVLTQFLYGGAVVGKEAPAYHKLRHGKLANKVPFPSQSAGIRLTVQVVVTTRYGSVKLNWPVKPVRK